MIQSTYTKEETLSFIDYLLKKEPVILDDQCFSFRSFFNSWTETTYHLAKDMLDMIRSAGCASRAYSRIAHESAKNNSLWKSFPEGGYMFTEDWEEYKCTHPSPLPPHIQKWEKHGNFLASRSIVADLFPTEYLIFLHRFESPDDQKITVSKIHVPLAGSSYREYQYTKRKIENRESKISQAIGENPQRMVLSVSSKESGIKISDFVPLAKFICQTFHVEQVCLEDRDETNIIVVNKSILL